MSRRRVVLAMSGGVDSSVAAGLLLEQGYEVIGVFMRHGELSSQACELGDGKPNPLLPILEGRLDHKQGCCSASDAADARRVADKLSIPFYALDLESEFKQIVDYFVDEYQQGRTPNPCVQCNNWIKFGRLFDYADAVDAYYVATGHYARMICPDSNASNASDTSDASNASGISGIVEPQWQLHRGLDDDKDQAYVLTGIKRHLLPRMLLPVGGYHKSQIRERAVAMGLKVADKRDSQEICFVTSGKHAEFVRNKSTLDTSGEIVTSDGKVVGHHAGIEGFTVGQRKGLGVAMGSPYYVTAVDRMTRRVVIGPPEELACRRLKGIKGNWLGDFPVGEPTRSQVQVRYNSPPDEAWVTRDAQGGFEVDFLQDVFGIAPGQLAAVFMGSRAMGCGWII
ncbi:MAG: tRNA 2-thiouridine(34) synthase MnmA [Planctomycetota bacterium]|nr:tRNA 2-thiouridine(34) synthase MnmA [Planctomycetota bacterium]